MYLNITQGLDFWFLPNKSKSIECFVNADFCSNWDKNFADVDAATAKSSRCWLSYLVGLKYSDSVATSTMVAEYIVLSSALRDVIFIMELLKEFANRGHNLISVAPKVYCKAFEDNSGALEITH